MISVIVSAASDPKALARLLTALVPAAAEGLVRDVAVLGGDAISRAIADDAGAELFPADALAEALAKSRSPWIAGLPLSAMFAPDWMELVAAHLAADDGKPAQLVARRAGLSLGGRAEGWLLPKRLAPSAVVVEQDLQRVVRRGGRRLRILDWR